MARLHFILGNNVSVALSDEAIQQLSSEEITNQANFEQIMRARHRLDSINRVGWSDFGENRSLLFTRLGFQQMVQEGRFIHLGLDIWFYAGTKIFVTLPGTVVEKGFEEGSGNYGGYIVTKHIIAEKEICFFFGHLNPTSLYQGCKFDANVCLGEIGDITMNGGYFEHTHFEVLTQAGLDAGYIHRGYETDKGFSMITSYVLDPKNYCSYIVYKPC